MCSRFLFFGLSHRDQQPFASPERGDGDGHIAGGGGSGKGVFNSRNACFLTSDWIYNHHQGDAAQARMGWGR